jgi:hypothetical protein
MAAKKLAEATATNGAASASSPPPKAGFFSRVN